jgi:predicted GNAT family N-acyltransferase
MMLTIIVPVSEPRAYAIEPAEWAAAGEALRAVRRRVFVEEQKVPEELEWDDEDASSRHVMAVAAGGMPVGTGRLLRDGHIGRMAVLKEWRGRGVGSALMHCLLRLAGEAGHAVVRLHAQIHAVGFYEKHGFVAEGEEFMEAGIPHVVMTRSMARVMGDG